VVSVDVSVDTLRTPLRRGKIYGIEKINQSLNNFFRKGNLQVKGRTRLDFMDDI